ncbi:MAG: coenzyme F420-0:L-glutamate ligase [Candidatus Promineifilaceae bacterium]
MSAAAGGPPSLTLTGVPCLPEIRPGDDLAGIISAGLAAAGMALAAGDVLVVAHKVVSKAEGRLVRLDEVRPGPRALALAAEVGKDPRLVELILAESAAVSRWRPGLLITRHRLGFTSANAAIDRSNVPQNGPGEWVALMPLDPDASAAALRRALYAHSGVQPGVVISDSHGRPFRRGTLGVAVGVAGLPAVWDRRGEADRQGYVLRHTEVGTADEIAAAAGLVMGQAAEGVPAVLARGLRLPAEEGRAADLIRPPADDLYR